jgi:autotransporter-associated beta strand protein
VILASNASANVNAVGELVLKGGTTSVGGNILDTSTSTKSATTLTLEGGTLDLTDGRIGGDGLSGNRKITALNFRSGTLKNVTQINNGAGLVKTTSGILILSGTNTYSGGTIVSNGTLRVSHATALTNAVTLSADTILDIAGSSPIAAPVIVSSLTSSGALLNVSTTDRLQVKGDMAGTFRLTLSDPGNLNKKITYVVAKFTGAPPTSVTLEGVGYPWRARVVSGEVCLIGLEGTLIRFH